MGKKCKVWVSKTHNLVCEINRDKKFPTIVFDAHLDEVSLRVIGYRDNGDLIAYTRGIDTKNIKGRSVTIHSRSGKDIEGVINVTASHFNKIKNDENDENDYEFMVDINIGANSKVKARKMVSIGDPVTLNSKTIEFKNGNISSRSLDNKLGVFILTQLLTLLSKKKLDVNIVGIFSSMEEEYSMGLTEIVDNINPDIVIVIDTEIANSDPSYSELKIGKGVCISTDYTNNSSLTNYAIDIAKKIKGLAYQLVFHDFLGNTNLDSLRSLDIMGQFIAIPAKNLHSPNEIASKIDIIHCLKLLLEMTKGFSKISKSLVSKK